MPTSNCAPNPRFWLITLTEFVDFTILLLVSEAFDKLLVVVRMKPFRWSLLCFVLLFSQSLAGVQSLRSFQLQAPDLFPESFAWDRVHNRFLVGSVFHGTISELAFNGSFSEFVRDEEYAGKAGVSGVKVDSRRNRVIVTVTETAAWNYGGVAAYDLDTKERVFFTRLDGVGVGEGSKSSFSFGLSFSFT